FRHAGGRALRQHEIELGADADTHAGRERLRADAFLLRRHLVVAAREANLDELALFVRLRFLMARDAVGEVDADLRAFDRLAFIVLDRPLHHAGALCRDRCRHRQRGHARERHQPGMTAVQSADHENPPRMIATVSLLAVYITCGEGDAPGDRLGTYWGQVRDVLGTGSSTSPSFAHSSPSFAHS